MLKFVDVGWSEGGYVTPSQSVHSKVHVEAITLDDILNLSKGKILIKMKNGYRGCRGRGSKFVKRVK